MIRDEQLMHPNKQMVWKKQYSGALRRKGGSEKQNTADGHLRRTDDRRSAMVKHKAIAHDYCIKAGIGCQQQKSGIQRRGRSNPGCLKTGQQRGNLY